MTPELGVVSVQVVALAPVLWMVLQVASSVERWMLKAVSLEELSVQVKAMLLVPGMAAEVGGGRQDLSLPARRLTTLELSESPVVFSAVTS